MTDDLVPEHEFEIPEGFEPMNWVHGFGRQMGPLFSKDTADGSYIRAFRVGQHHVNGMGNCHGGMLMAFSDIAFGHIVGVKTNRYWVTVRLLTDFMSSAKLGDWVEGTGEIMGHADDIYTVRGRIWTGDKTLMTGTGTFKALGERPSK